MEIQQQLKVMLRGHDLLVVGHSLRDERIRELATQVTEAGGAVWYVNPKPVPECLEANKSVRAIIGPDCTFEHVFPLLAEGLGEAAPAAPAAPDALTAAVRAEPAKSGAATIDDLMRSVVALMGPEGMKSSTGFVLAEPRCIIADGYSAKKVIRKGSVTVSSGQEQFRARVLRTLRGSPFGPVILEVPPECKLPGLRVNAGRLHAGMKVLVGIAAGERIGLSSGMLNEPREKDVNITPKGLIKHLVELACFVTQGACGAPVVDDSYSVLGFIVAGNDDPNHPVSCMHPARRWARDLIARRTSKRT